VLDVAFTDQSRTENGKLDGTFHDSLIYFAHSFCFRLGSGVPDYPASIGSGFRIKRAATFGKWRTV
jgi:hypothetical protein